MVGESAEYVRFVGSQLGSVRSPLFKKNLEGRSHLWEKISRDLALFCCGEIQSAPFEMVEIDRIVGGKRGWGDARVKRICRKGRSATH
ncbi:hypothetical protein [Microcoleus sp. PH2017_38_RDM_U_B]|uniref:hypothetical protein n=1 Tax=Microcoleus sp. PH2017_38_RDM_U_B TaxID=2798848 RepID=UPI001DE460E3|nr:hypothetical protein [Microcoleus sp. PH2017_38_RDM_U_B]MCC3614984.1 hypothetical protein [Microcoleus sp. PH2017_38_RDM_U_B]